MKWLLPEGIIIANRQTNANKTVYTIIVVCENDRGTSSNRAILSTQINAYKRISHPAGTDMRGGEYIWFDCPAMRESSTISAAAEMKGIQLLTPDFSATREFDLTIGPAAYIPCPSRLYRKDLRTGVLLRGSVTGFPPDKADL